MSTLLNILKYLYGALTYAARKVFTIWGLLGTAFAGVVAFVGSMFSRFTWFSEISSFVSDAQASVSVVLAYLNQSYPLVQLLFYTTALDRLCQSLAWLIILSIGVTALVFVTIYLVFISLVPSIMLVRLAIRAVKFATLKSDI